MKSKKPAYIRLYELLRDEITRGIWPRDTRMPSRRVLARERGLSEITVEHSYDLLCQEGYIEARARSGYYVAFRASDVFLSARESSALPKAPEENREWGTQFPFAMYARAVRKVLSEMDEAILLRSPSCGLQRLREALARYLERNRGMRVSAGQIVMGSGAEYLYGIAVELLGHERTFAIEAPSYEKIEQVYRAHGVIVELLPLDRDGIRSDALNASSASVLHITPYRSFPSGVTADASKRREYLKWAQIRNRFIVEDDFESEFSLLRKPEETLFANSRSGNVIYLNTFSRTISPALRTGYMVLPESLVEEYEERLGFYSCTVPTLEQYVLCELIESGEFERHINRIRRGKRRDSAKAAVREEEEGEDHGSKRAADRTRSSNSFSCMLTHPLKY